MNKWIILFFIFIGVTIFNHITFCSLKELDPINTESDLVIKSFLYSILISLFLGFVILKKGIKK